MWEGGSVSHAELHEHARAAVPEAGVAPTTEPAGREFAVTLHGAWLAGGAIAPLNPALERPRLAERLPEGTLALMHTSGSTGQPRAVALTRAHFAASAHATGAHLGLRATDRWLCCLPVFHVGGLSIFTRCAFYGATVVAEPSFDAARVRAALESGDVTLVSLVPTMLLRLREAGFERAPALRGILLGGGPIPEELLEWARSLNLPVMPTYGMTETCSQIATAPPGERLARPLAGVELRIADDGEIVVRGPMVAVEGWLRTGDRGRLTEEGLLEVQGRMDDLIVTGGENVAASEVEEALLAHPAVRDAAVVGVDDPEWGRAVTAFVAADASESELLAHCRGRLARFKVPKRIVLLDEVPRNPAGKVVRGRLPV